STIEPFSWGYRNPYGIRFAPDNHALKGGLFVTENGEDERGARPTNNAPDRLQLAQQNRDGSPDYHGWPDRFGFLDSTQAVFNPVGGPGDDIHLINFSRPGGPLQLQRFAHNSTFEQAFTGQIHGINRPVDLKFGPDDCAYLVDYGAVRDFGQSDPASRFCPAKLLDGVTPNPSFPACLTDGSAPLVQIPRTGVIWKICRVGEREPDSDRDD